jgi:hypothetical protein
MNHLTHDAENNRVKCPECGVVESRQEVERADLENHHETNARLASIRNGQSIKSYQVTLRMKDGSSHQFVDTNPANWRPGERVILISGTNK